jgi:hypothetical protein
VVGPQQLGNNVLLTSYRHALGHYIVIPCVERTELQPLARGMEFLGEIHLERFAGDVQSKILERGRLANAFVCLSRREFMRLRSRSSEQDQSSAGKSPRWLNNRKGDLSPAMGERLQ